MFIERLRENFMMSREFKVLSYQDQLRREIIYFRYLKILMKKFKLISNFLKMKRMRK